MHFFSPLMPNILSFLEINLAQGIQKVVLKSDGIGVSHIGFGIKRKQIETFEKELLKEGPDSSLSNLKLTYE